MTADLAVIGNHDHLIASVLIFGALGWAVLATLVVAFFKGASGGPTEPEDSRSVKEWLALDPEAPLYSDLADEQPAVVETLDAARPRRSGS